VGVARFCSSFAGAALAGVLFLRSGVASLNAESATMLGSREASR